jgi:hypothetical protein
VSALAKTGKIKRAFANVSASQTDSEIVAAVTGRRIRVLAVVLLCGATATTITFNSKGSGAGTAITFQFQNAANSGAVLGDNEKGWFETSLSEALTVTTGTGSTTGVQVVYQEW